MSVDHLEKVLEGLGTTESKSEVGGKIRVTSLLWEAPKVICPAKCWRCATSMARPATTIKADPPVEVYDPYEPYTGIDVV